MVRFAEKFSLRLAIPPTSLDWDWLLTRETTECTDYMSSKSGDKLTKSRGIFFVDTYKLHNVVRLEHSWHLAYYSETISYKYKIKLSR